MALLGDAPGRDLTLAMVPIDDAYAQQCALVERLLPRIHAVECQIADTNCTVLIFELLINAWSQFVVREHASTPLASASEWKTVQLDQEREVSEPHVAVRDGDAAIEGRRISVELTKATRDGEGEVFLLSNVTETESSAQPLGDAYRTRWTIEKAFARMVVWLNCERDSLGNPNAALLAFTVGHCAYALESLIQATLAVAHGAANARRLSCDKPRLISSAAKMLTSDGREADAMQSVRHCVQWHGARIDSLGAQPNGPGVVIRIHVATTLSLLVAFDPTARNVGRSVLVETGNRCWRYADASPDVAASKPRQNG
jgi:hypothetical protein